MQQLGSTDLKRLHRSWRRKGSFRLALLLEAVQSPFNLGSIVRTAAAMGAEELFLVGETAIPNSSKAQRTAMGTDRYLRWRTYTDIASAVADIRADGYRVVGLELADQAVPLASVDLAQDVCLAVGNEDRGLSSACLASCDVVAFAPQVGRVGSLNVTAAAAIGCYEVRRQGWDAKDDQEPPALDDEALDPDLT